MGADLTYVAEEDLERLAPLPEGAEIAFERGGHVDRVVVSPDTAVPPLDDHDVDVVFIRADGWVLGAPERFEAAAYAMWSDEWHAFARRDDSPPWVVRGIEEYAP